MCVPKDKKKSYRQVFNGLHITELRENNTNNDRTIRKIITSTAIVFLKK